MNSKHKNRFNYCLICLIYCRNLIIKTQIVESENIVYWKYTLIIESCWKQACWQQRDDSKRWIQRTIIFYCKSKRENFLEHSMLARLSSQDFQLCLVRKLASLFIDDEVELESILSLDAWKFFEIRHHV